MEALDQAESYLPSDVPAQPQVTFSTGRSWQEIAGNYGRIVDEKAVEKDKPSWLVLFQEKRIVKTKLQRSCST
jgi:hypothetical protein